MRKLPTAAQEERRRQVVGLCRGGLTYKAIAAQVGLSRTGVIDICQRYAAEGTKGLASKLCGRNPDEQRLLDAAQEADVQKLIRRHTPDELGLPFALRSRAAVGMLISRQCGVELVVRTAGKYLARWGFTARKPIRRAYEQDPAAVRHWLRRECTQPSWLGPGRHVASSSGAMRPVCAQMMCAAAATPRVARHRLVRVCHKRASLSLISAAANRGELRWMIVDCAVNAPSLIRGAVAGAVGNQGGVVSSLFNEP